MSTNTPTFEGVNQSFATLKYETILYVIIFCNTLITVMNTSVFNVALPTIRTTFQVGETELSLMMSVYSVSIAISTLLYSKLCRIYPTQYVLSIGITLLVVGSLIGFFAQYYWLLVLARIIQALGAGAMSATGMYITTVYIPYERRGQKLAIVGMGITLAFGLGPLIGGVTTEFLGWRYLFALSIIPLFTLPMYYLSIPVSKIVGETFNIKGLVSFALAFYFLILGISVSPVYLLLTSVLFLYLIMLNRKKGTLFFDVTVLQNRHAKLLILIGAIVYSCNFSVLFIIPLILNDMYQIESALLIGLCLIPGATVAVLTSYIAGKLVDKIEVRKIAQGGILLIVSANLLGCFFSHFSIAVLVVLFAISSSGFVCMTTSIPKLLVNNLNENNGTAGIGLMQMCQFLGAALGVVFTGLILTYFLRFIPDLAYSMVFLYIALLGSIKIVLVNIK